MLGIINQRLEPHGVLGIAVQVVPVAEVDVIVDKGKQSFVSGVEVADAHGFHQRHAGVPGFVIPVPVVAEPEHTPVYRFQNVFTAGSVIIGQHGFHTAVGTPGVIVVHLVIGGPVGAHVSVGILIFQHTVYPGMCLVFQKFVIQTKGQQHQAIPVVPGNFSPPSSFGSAPAFVGDFVHIGICNHLRFQFIQMSAHPVTAAEKLFSEPSFRTDRTQGQRSKFSV